MSDTPRLLLIGRILGPHGIRGEVKVAPLTDFPETRYAPGRRLLLDPDGALTVAHMRPHKTYLLIKFEEVPDRNMAEELTGRELAVEASEAVELPEGSFWVDDLVGLRVRTVEGRSVGTVREVLRSPANDVYVVESPSGGEILVPATKEAVAAVELESGELVINPLPGLLEEDL